MEFVLVVDILLDGVMSGRCVVVDWVWGWTVREVKVIKEITNYETLVKAYTEYGRSTGTCLTTSTGYG